MLSTSVQAKTICLAARWLHNIRQDAHCTMDGPFRKTVLASNMRKACLLYLIFASHQVFRLDYEFEQDFEENCALCIKHMPMFQRAQVVIMQINLSL